VLVSYFGESLQQDCGSCDNCRHPVPLEDRTIDAQKLLSCVYRCRQRFGLRYIIDVLRGKSDERILNNGHDRLTTFGIGQDLTVPEWQALGQSLVHQEYLSESTDGYGILIIGDRGMAVLKRELTVEVPQLQPAPTAAVSSATPATAPLSPAADDLFQHLRQLRKQLADRQSVPPYIIFSDRTLQEMAERQPTTLAAFSQLTGVGQKKLKLYGDTFLSAIDQFCDRVRPPAAPLPTAAPTEFTQTSSPQPDSALPSLPPVALPGPVATNLGAPIGDTQLETLRLHQQGLTPQAIAAARQLTPQTIYNHLAGLLAAGEAVNLDAIVAPARQRQIFRAIYDLHSYTSLTTIREMLEDECSYDEIRLVRAALFGQS
jgi:ATP-dependent DNA helicase RecQ